MSVSKSWTTDATNVRNVVALYRSKEFLSMAAIARRLETTYHNVRHVVKVQIPEDERRALKAIRYSQSKTGDKNPMKGKTGEQHHNWKGLCADGYGYLTCLYLGRRRLVHRVVAAQMLGIRELPRRFAVHHIDGDKTNNAEENLAIVTNAGHRQLHYLQSKDSLAVKLKKSTLAEAARFMTSQ